MIDPGIDAYPDGPEGWLRERAEEAYEHGISRARAIELVHQGYDSAELDRQHATDLEAGR